jgi:hypothetical protein
MSRTRPAFLITIDTEGDDLWSSPREITTRNAAFLPRFQALCEAHGLKPTYLTNYEMAMSPVFREFAHDVVRRGTAEIGMHLHAWNSPPIEPLTADDFRFQPYLIEYPADVLRRKVAYLTELLEDTFAAKMTSHRAGRWSFDATYAGVLVDHGYVVDCSVTPHVSWRHLKGDPGQAGGTDFSRFPEHPYWVDLSDISRSGDSPLLELPMTVMRAGTAAGRWVARRLPAGSLPGRVWNRFVPSVHWLRPNGRNVAQMIGLLERAKQEGRSYVELMLHSSEFMPNGSPTFRTSESIEALYGDLEQLFAAAAAFRGATLTEFHAECVRERQSS